MAAFEHDMITIEFPITVTIRCERYYGSAGACADDVVVQGTASINERLEIDSVPSEQDILGYSSYEAPEGWVQNWRGAFCPNCVAKDRHKQ